MSCFCVVVMGAQLKSETCVYTLLCYLRVRVFMCLKLFISPQKGEIIKLHVIFIYVFQVPLTKKQ